MKMPPGYWKEFYARNRERLRAKNPARYQLSKEATKARSKAWALAHPERRKEIVAKCKAKPEVKARAKVKAREWRIAHLCGPCNSKKLTKVIRYSVV